MRDISVPALAAPLRSGGLADSVFDTAEQRPDFAQLARRDAEGAGWREVSAAEFRDEVMALARGLLADGVRPGARVALMSRTRYEWTLFSYALWAVGAQLVPVYPTASAEQLRSILAGARVAAIVVEHEAQAMTVAAACDERSGLRRIWQLDRDCVRRLAEEGTRLADADVHRLRHAVTPRSIAAIVYTSGTTGRPRGCVITHANLASECDTLHAGWGELLAAPGERPSLLAFLPLAHIYGLMLQVACIRGGVLLGHQPDLSVDALLPAFASFRPTVVFAVPYLFEKVCDRARRAAEQAGRRRLFDAAMTVAVRYAEAVAEQAQGTGRGPDAFLRARHAVYERLVYSRIRELLGGRVRTAVSGGSPLRRELGLLYAGAGITVYDGYGLTETTGAITVQPPGRVRFGTVGRPLPGSSMHLALDGEVWVRGSVVFAGYLDEGGRPGSGLYDGWLPTGDLGHLDEEGYLVITGRKKDIIITSSGKSVAPQALEQRLHAHPLISQCVVIGDNRPYVTALITLDPEALAHWRQLNGLDATEGSGHGDRGRDGLELSPEEQVRAEVQRAVARANSSVSRAESIRAFRILPGEFSQEAGLMTPSLKLRRAAIVRAYAAEIDAMYAQGERDIRESRAERRRAAARGGWRGEGLAYGR
ncbi:long-chain fatty acid--CoA ligase [Streptomyces piniterrae]|uniref:Long-chain fatty acid--CoA ligase n=1 Tax=Streptomyces piniterrae TaxID=2571125 RepID=A0A4U0P012_9ACTN|nr:AMP-dependent synthetase/ligase [Streptomyces piniterrae]TJZ55994.1 long-chain fatty acid--CoA ligase [Streptomyces piniterrae]